MLRKIAPLLACLGVLCATLAGALPAAAQGKKLVLGLPGIPPIFGAVIAYVAQDEGFWKKLGVDVELRQFDTGTAAARAVASGDIELSLSPTPLVVNQISNADVNVVAIYGMSNPDWLIGSTDKGKVACQDLVGQPVGVDAVGAARSLALKEILAGCGVKIEDVKQVALGSNTGPAMVAGQLTFGVLHLDDVPSIEAQGKTVSTVATMAKTNPNSHYLLLVAPRDKLAANRDAYVKLLAGLIAAGHFMQDPKNADRVAAIAKPTGRTTEEANGSLKRYIEMGFWAIDDDGLDRKKLAATVESQIKLGNVKDAARAVTYDRLVDQSVWRDASPLAKK
jgi:ABC-type nitrate/sulfonate/bicarbonate transport system substrate-binding protein